MACAFEDAGFHIRDQLAWVHPQGMSKSMDLAKQIDRTFFEMWLDERGIKHETPKQRRDDVSDYMQGRGLREEFIKLHGLPEWGQPKARPDNTVDPAHPEAKAHYGEGTLLRPVWEPIVLARKPMTGTLVQNAREYNTGFLNINDCRIPTSEGYVINRFTSGAKPFGDAKGEEYESVTSSGRLPSNLMIEPGGTVDPSFARIEGNPAPAKPQKRDTDSLDTRAQGFRFKRGSIHHNENDVGDGHLGGYTRMFVIPKPSPKEKDLGLEHVNKHPTVKPVSLMRHLVKLVTPHRGTCIDPFMGSGTTGMACVDEERAFIGIELDQASFDDATARINYKRGGHEASFESILEMIGE
jgi:site-specific DNA-methyltransferase (adenine-specific)